MPPFTAGCVFMIDDGRVHMPPEQRRTQHSQRPILVVSKNEHNYDSEWPIVLACPISSGRRSTEYDVKLGAGDGGLAKAGWVRVTLIQPFDKSHLGDCPSLTGIPKAALRAVHANVVDYMGA